MSKTPLLIATAFALCATTLIADQAEARERSRAVQRTAQGGSVAVERSNAWMKEVFSEAFSTRAVMFVA